MWSSNRSAMRFMFGTFLALRFDDHIGFHLNPTLVAAAGRAGTNVVGRDGVGVAVERGVIDVRVWLRRSSDFGAPSSTGHAKVTGTVDDRHHSHQRVF